MLTVLLMSFSFSSYGHSLMMRIVLRSLIVILNQMIVGTISYFCLSFFYLNFEVGMVSLIATYFLVSLVTTKIRFHQIGSCFKRFRLINDYL